jgi:hypothetical protein
MTLLTKEFRVGDLALVFHTPLSAQKPAKSPVSWNNRGLPRADGANEWLPIAGPAELDPQMTSQTNIELLLSCLDLLIEIPQRDDEMLGEVNSPLSRTQVTETGLWVAGSSEQVGGRVMTEPTPRWTALVAFTLALATGQKEHWSRSLALVLTACRAPPLHFTAHCTAPRPPHCFCTRAPLSYTAPVYSHCTAPVWLPTQ